MEIAIFIGVLLVVVFIAATICVSCDGIERRWRLWRLRVKMSKQPDLSDHAFAGSLNDLPADDVIEMRNFLATILRINPLKIHPDWKFAEEPHVKFPGRTSPIFVFQPFAIVYAPERLRQCCFMFPIGEVVTVSDMIHEAVALKYDLAGDLHTQPPKPESRKPAEPVS